MKAIKCDEAIGYLPPRIWHLLMIFPMVLFASCPAIAWSLRLDFGPREQIPPDGFTAIGATAIFSAERGYGWLSAPVAPFYMRDGRASVNWLQPSATCAPLVQDFVYGSGPAILRVAVPNGRYHVFVLAVAPPLGMWLPMYDYAITVEDIDTEHVQLPYPCTVAHPRFDVTVTDNFLDVRFDSISAWIVNAIIVCDDADLPAMNVQWNAWQRELMFIPQGELNAWRAVAVKAVPVAKPRWQVIGELEVAISFAEPFNLCNVASSADYSAGMPASSNNGNMYDGVAIAGMRTWFGMLIKSMGYSGVVDVQVSPWVNPQDNIGFETTIAGRLLNHYKWIGYPNNRIYAMVPCCILPCDTFTIIPETIETLLLMVDVPRNVPTGIYHSTLRLTNSAGKSDSMDLRLLVLSSNVQFDDARIQAYIAYEPLLLHSQPAWTSPLKQYLQQRTVAQLQDIKRHGFTGIWLTHSNIERQQSALAMEQLDASVLKWCSEIGLQVRGIFDAPPETNAFQLGELFPPNKPSKISTIAMPSPAITKLKLDNASEIRWLFIPASALSGDPAWVRFLHGVAPWALDAKGVLTWHYCKPYGNPYCDFDGSAPDACLTHPTMRVNLSSPEWEATRAGLDDGALLMTFTKRLNEMKAQQAQIKANDSIATAEQFLNSVRSWAIAQLRELLKSNSARHKGDGQITWRQLESIRLLTLVHLSNLGGGLEIPIDTVKAFERACNDAQANAPLPVIAQNHASKSTRSTD